MDDMILKYLHLDIFNIQWLIKIIVKGASMNPKELSSISWSEAALSWIGNQLFVLTNSFLSKEFFAIIINPLDKSIVHGIINLSRDFTHEAIWIVMGNDLV